MTLITKGWISIPALAAVGAAVIAGYGRADTAGCPNQYVIDAAIGMPVPMYTMDQFNSQHPKTGHVMLRGQMAMSGMSGSSTMAGSSPGAMGSGEAMGSESAAARHLEVYIHSKATGAVVPDANPQITVTDKTAGGTPQNVPVAVMESIGPSANLVPETVHYGNTVSIPAGHHFTATVTVGCQTASFDLVSPGGTEVSAAPSGMSAMNPGTGAPPAGTPSMGTMPNAPTPKTGVFSGAELPLGVGSMGLGTLLVARARRRRRLRSISTAQVRRFS